MEKRKCIEGETKIDNVMCNQSSATQSDSRRLGDELNYKLDYEYAKGYAHRVNRIGTRYYQYDENGNLTVEQEWPFNNGETGNGNDSVPTVFDLGDGVYVTDHGWGMVEDTPGNNGKTPSSVYRRDYRWNERNLLAISSDNRYSVLYTYGADGERSGKFSTRSSGGSATETLYFNRMWTWRYDGLLNDRTGQNSKHIYLGETRLVTKIGRADGSFTGEEKAKQYWYHSDHLGSAQLITNVEGEKYERIEYTPYGELWVERASVASNIDIPYRFTGKERDEETGLYYYGARYLDPKTSRWLSTDPALSEYIPGAPINDEAKKRNSNLPGMGGIFNTVNLHLYHYAGNNPVKYTDPNGREDVYFLYTYKETEYDQKMKSTERASINEEVAALKASGLTVKVVESATKDDIIAAFSDSEAKMIVTSGHGYDAAMIQSSDGKTVSPSDIQKSTELHTVIFENCYQGDYKDEWGKTLGPNVDVVGWEGTMTTSETRRFNNTGFFDRQKLNLGNYVDRTIQRSRMTSDLPRS